MSNNKNPKSKQGNRPSGRIGKICKKFFTSQVLQWLTLIFVAGAFAATARYACIANKTFMEIQKQTTAVIISQLPLFKYDMFPGGQESVPKTAYVVITNIGRPPPGILRSIKITSMVAEKLPRNPWPWVVRERKFPPRTFAEIEKPFQSPETEIAITDDQISQIKKGGTLWVYGVWCFGVFYNPLATVDTERREDGCEHGYFGHRFARRYDPKSHSFIHDESIPSDYTER